MSDDTKAAAPDAVTEKQKQDATEPQKPTVGDIISEPKETSKTVPEAVFLELKTANKELKKELKDLKQSIEGGATKRETSSSIDDIADEYGVDKKFLKTFADTIRTTVEKESESKFAERLKPFEERERAEKLQQTFAQHFKATLEEMPEYDGIVNKDVIFALSLNPANAKKTLAQLVEDTYGSAIKGRKSIETATNRIKSDGGFDPDRANRDVEYLKEVYANPTLKKEFDAWKAKNRRV